MYIKITQIRKEGEIEAKENTKIKKDPKKIIRLKNMQVQMQISAKTKQLILMKATN